MLSMIVLMAKGRREPAANGSENFLTAPGGLSVLRRRAPRPGGGAPRHGRQRIEIRFGGQYVAKTLPIRFVRGTVPHSRESQDCERLSPIMKYCPCGTLYVSGPRVSRLFGWMYGSSSLSPSMKT